MLLYTVQNLVDETRSMLDEADADAISDTTDILPALNRGSNYAFDIYARKYPEPLLEYTTLTLTSGTAEYDMPESVFEDRLQKVEIIIPGSNSSTYREVERISYRDISRYETAGTVDIPLVYCVLGRKIRLVGTPSGAYNARIWYLREPEKLVLPQGRITRVSVASNYVIVDEVGSYLTTESDQLGSYVNLVDGQTGLVKASLQIQSISSGRVTFRTSTIRSTVLGRTIATAIPSTIGEDDYICAIDGICVPYYPRPTNNFLVQYAVAEMTGKLGGTRTTEEQLLDKFEKQVARTWVGRESQMRIRKKSRIWTRWRI